MINTALIVAAGSGVRLAAETPKQYLSLAGQPLIRWTAEVFLKHPDIDQVRVVINPDHRFLFDAATAGLGLGAPVPGGATRQESVIRGLESLETSDCRNVLIHDAARPFVSAGIVGRVLAALDDAPGAIPAIPVADTLKDVEDDIVNKTVDRSRLWRAQTPQAFRYRDILAAHCKARDSGFPATDDAAVAEFAGLAVKVVAGAEENFKITSPEDMSRAEAVLRSGEPAAGREFRTGLGFDVHRFGGSGPMKLCGVVVQQEGGLQGHSDADVGLHALTDAIFGAACRGDIGSHFPPSDPRWSGADSTLFVAHALDVLHSEGGQLVHADITLICETPKIAPFRDRMKSRLAELLGLAPERVSVKATTTEGLGFTGRREGIAAQTIVTAAFSGQIK